jgi:hypothetical protein
MTLLSPFLPLLFSLFLLAGFMKLAALLYRRAQVSWKLSFLVASVLLVLTIIRSLLNAPFMLDLPSWVNIGLGMSMFVAIGGAILRGRARSAGGQPFTFRDGAGLCAIAGGLMLAFAAILFVVMLQLAKA